MFTQISSSYEHALFCCYHRISKRGLLIDEQRLGVLRNEVVQEISKLSDLLSNTWGLYTYVGSIKPTTYVAGGNSVNINSSSGDNSLLNCLKNLGYNVPKTRKKDSKTHDVTFEESADHLTLLKIFAETKDPSIEHVLKIKELTKLLSTYINARLYNSLYLSSYNPAGTVTGRRSCGKNIFGFGGNGQTLPTHSKIGKKYLECIVSRPGFIYFKVDQISAEDWPVNALAGNIRALKELSATTWPESDRHSRLAADVFGISIDKYTKEEWKDETSDAGKMRYVGGKKARHANNYGMRENRFSEELARYGFAFPPKVCKQILEKVNALDPAVDAVYHKYVKDQLNTTRILRTPLGRERQFFGLRPNAPNYEIYNEAYSYIPQSVVGDNTGMAVLCLDGVNNFIVQESHDSICQEVPDTLEDLEHTMLDTEKAFDRTIRFYNGIEIKIPLEAQLAYNMGTSVKLKNFTIDDLRIAYKTIIEQKEALCAPTF